MAHSMSEREYRKERRAEIRQQLEKRNKEEERREAIEMERHYSQLSNADRMLQRTYDCNREGVDLPMNMEGNGMSELLKSNRNMNEIENLEENTSVFENIGGDNMLTADLRRGRRNTDVAEHNKYDEMKIERECVSMPDISQEIKELDMRLELLESNNIETFEKYAVSKKTDLEFPINGNAADDRKEKRFGTYPKGNVETHRQTDSESERTKYSSSRTYPKGDVETHRKTYTESERTKFSSSRHGSAYENSKGKDFETYPRGNGETIVSKGNVGTYRAIPSRVHDSVKENEKGKDFGTYPNEYVGGESEILKKDNSYVGTRPKHEMLSPIYAHEVDNELRVRLGTEKERSSLQEQTKKREKKENDKEAILNLEMEHEKYLVKKLEEQNRKLDIERKIREEEERLIMERIEKLNKAEEELNRQRMERKELEKEVQKKIELEDLRRKKLSLLHYQEEELVRSLSNLEDNRREETKEHKKEREMFDPYDNAEGHVVVFDGYDHNERETINRKPERYGYGKPKIPPFDGMDFKISQKTAKVLFEQFFIHYGFPERIHSDQGANFESTLIKELCQLTGTIKSHTTPYHAMGNGMVERFNQTLLKMLGTLDEDKKADWKSYVGHLVHAYNVTIHDSTGFEPYYMMFGRQPKLAIDALLGLNVDDLNLKSRNEYVRKLRDRLTSAYNTAKQVANKTSCIDKHYYDQKAKASSLQPGDIVLVRNVSIRGKNKIADRWENEPYTIIDKPRDEIPVFRVRKLNPKAKKIRTLHRNLLQPLRTSKKTCEVLTENKNKSDSHEQKYIIPQRRNENIGSDDNVSILEPRPKRDKRKPEWQRSGDWMMN